MAARNGVDRLCVILKPLKRDALASTVYAYNGNKLTGLTGGLTGTYTYDDNGNATKDRTGMLFSYNHLNLPQSASKTGTSVTYLYDATGTKLQKKSTVGAVNASRDYINGIEYNGTDIDLIHNSAGYALKSGTNYVYHYNLTDHLGNVRATLKRGSTATAVDVTQRDNYYPFGKQKVVAGGNNRRSVAMSSFVPLKDKLIIQIIIIFTMARKSGASLEDNMITELGSTMRR